jgi:hypothetical protein
MTAAKPKSIIVVSLTVFILGLTMFGYWTKYILDGMPLENIPIIPEGIAAVLALLTGIGLFRLRQWSLASGLILCGLWIYGCVGGINLVFYHLIVAGRLNFQSPVGAWTDAILFFLISAWSVFLAVYLWKMRRHFSAGFSVSATQGANDR